MGDEGKVTGEAIRCLESRLEECIKDSVEADVAECVAPVAVACCLMKVCSHDIAEIVGAIYAAAQVYGNDFEKLVAQCVRVGGSDGQG